MSNYSEQPVSSNEGVTLMEALSIAEGFAVMAQNMGTGEDLETVLERICALATNGVESCKHAAVSLIEARGRLSTHGATDEIATRFEMLQFEAGEGPAIDAMRETKIVDVADLSHDHQWPKFAERAVGETGVRSVLSFPLAHRGYTLGALNLYAREPRAFHSDRSAVRWGRVFSMHASVGLSGAKTERDLRAALDTRETISVAVGVLMARQRIDRQHAFDILRRASQRMNLKLRDVAAQVAGGNAEEVTSHLDLLERDSATF